MSKSPDAFRTISEVADWLGVQAHVLRFWESRFSQIKPVKRAGGRRYYRPNDMRLLGGIKKLLHEEGVTIKGVQRILREQGVAYVASLSPGLDEDAAPAPTVDVQAQAEKVVPLPQRPAAVQGALDLSPIEATDQAAGEATAPESPDHAAAPTRVNETAPQQAGIAARAWRKTEFDTDTLRRIAPVAKDLRAWLDRVERQLAG
ncbi:MerR HTH family regulatory protein [Ruegeria intermedia]|uniref:MerR HTH family regulatory protein n=1 Tax=Ruegeria intermedia TaxID=996115 RepID=A0A1M4UNX7_9RHOB|nr:MerR family transcriptional regulator [Ruegeria intermedia]SHE58290.1 MerR HTH family regulatory protein [Ruegeria intermedia]